MEDIRKLVDVAFTLPPKRACVLHALLLEPHPVEIATVITHVWPDADCEPGRPWDSLFRSFRLINETLADVGYAIVAYWPHPRRYRIERRAA